MVIKLDLGDMFTNGADLTVKGGTSIAFYGPTKIGKTTMIASACKINGEPSPVIVVDTENNFALAVKLLPEDEQKLFDVVEVMVPIERNIPVEENKGRRGTRAVAADSGVKLKKPVDVEKSLIKLNAALTKIADTIAKEPAHVGSGVAGTIALDSASDFYDWRNQYFEMPGHHKEDNKGNILRFDWKTVTEAYLDAIQTLLLSNWNIILTYKSKPIFVGPEETDMQAPHWHKRTGFYVRMEIEMSHDGVDYIAEMVKDRYGNIGSTLKNATFDDILADIEDKSGLVLR